MSAKVVHLRSQRVLQLSLDQLVGFEGVKVLAKLIQEWHLQNPENRIKVLAQKANLTPTTVSRILNRDTKSPRMLTCIMLFKALGFSAVRLE
jgi:hypothetical protein